MGKITENQGSYAAYALIESEESEKKVKYHTHSSKSLPSRAMLGK